MNREKIRKIKYAPPPLELPIYGKVDAKECSFFGRTNYEAALETKKFIFGIKRGDRRRHIYTVGKSGVGKSKFLELLIRQDIAHGHGICLIDPHGDLIESILDFIPKAKLCSLEEEIYPKLIEAKQLYAFATSQKFYDIGSHNELKTIKEVLR